MRHDEDKDDTEEVTRYCTERTHTEDADEDITLREYFIVVVCINDQK